MNQYEIERFLHDEIDDVDAIPQASTRLSWDTSTIPELFGWSWPKLTEEGYVVRFCPDRIHETMQAVFSEEDDHEEYLRAVIATLHLHIAFTDDFPDPGERATVVDQYIHDRASGSVDLLSAVQLAALDATK